MANRERGEIEIIVKEKPYTLKVSTNAMAVIQTRHKKTLGDMLAGFGTLDVIAIRSVVWVLLQKHHAKQFTTEEQAGEFIDDAGGLAVVMNILTELVAANNEGANPPTAQEPSGTGESSTLTLAASA